jgi:hypothetical protein
VPQAAGAAVSEVQRDAAADPAPETATDRVYEAIYAALLEQRLCPGEWLREADLAASFGVSRTLIRQALLRLAQDRLIVLRHNHGARVPQPDLLDAPHVFAARRVAECEIARQLGGRLHDGQFSIGVIRPDGTGERMLATAFHAEGPTWAPNGRVLMYFKERTVDGGRGRIARLYAIDLTGSNEREIITPRDASDPAWSPLIP